MAEEGMQDTANRRIHIGKPIEFDEEKFLAQLQELSEYVAAVCFYRNTQKKQYRRQNDAQSKTKDKIQETF